MALRGSPRRAAGQAVPGAILLILVAATLRHATPGFSAPVLQPRATLLTGAIDATPGPSNFARVEALERVEPPLRALQSAAAEAPRPQSAWGILSGAAAVLGLAFRGRRMRSLRAEAADAEPAKDTEPEPSTIQKAATIFCNLFAVWLAVAAIAAVNAPPTFTWVKSSYFTGLLGLLMFSVGITTTIDDFKACFSRPGAVAINFFSCYAIMPLLAYAIAKAIGAEGAILAGMVLVGSINGGQASNLCTLIAGGDVALSVLMTTSTTLGCILMTPLICKIVLGAVVPVDAMGIVISTFEVVLAPIFLGVGANTLAPNICKKVAPFTPVIGVIATVLLVGASVAKCAEPILGAGLPLQAACLALHLVGGLLGYGATKVTGYDERTCRTVAIETAMKSSAFGFLLASLHFGAFNVRVPSAVSVVWMAIVGSVLAVYWKGKPTPVVA
eukprot:CAMPEP_0171073626 /NCGR_PEP_ID=MMETSP0766_2-20121228/11626_1 /TAXON_ID=439317 /ORGANISM="Gambierdiscus australes, Strain CAWD 149" /LENGTH=442 /DNA_ID=CAMNT_0011530339 /DNA_START=1 /DNA_END=1329 /DNA_ORIENTATION=+